MFRVFHHVHGARTGWINILYSLYDFDPSITRTEGENSFSRS